MNPRAKTFDATGVAPNGRLYAGDLNLIQDLVAALADLTQNLQVGTLAVGESGLLISRFGAGEAALAGALRISGIVRMLGGYIPPQMTTTVRNALPAGAAPFGLIIHNTTTARQEWNAGTDGARNWQPFGADGSGISTVPPPDGSITLVKMAANSVDSSKIVDASVVGGDMAAATVTTREIHGAVPLVPLGASMDWPWASGSIPAWTALPYGQQLTRAGGFGGLVDLGVAAGHPHGAGDANTVTLPDYRGRVGAGKDNMGGATASRITVAVSGSDGTTLGAVLGTEGITLTTAQLPAHNHTMTGSPGLSDPTHKHPLYTAGGQLISGNAGGAAGSTLIDDSQYYTGNVEANSAYANYVSTGISVSVGTLGTANAGSGSAHRNMQPTIIVNKIMRVV